MRLDRSQRGQQSEEPPETVDSTNEIESAETDTAHQDDEHEVVVERTRGGATRRRFLGRSGKLLIYAPPLIQLFIPTKAMAASPSS